MKKSMYNYLLEQNGKFYMYNPYAGLLKVSRDVYEQYTLNDVDDFPQELQDSLFQKKFLVENDNEFLQFSIMRNRLIYSRDTLLLEIAPTLRCNCSCNYCFVRKSSITMNIETENEIVAFVAARIEHGVKNVKITWFGGEPLLEYERLVSLSCKLIDLCEKKQVNYQAFLITNGLLLTDSITSHFRDLKIQGVQITLDGTEYSHNTERPTSIGNGYKIILQNLNLFDGEIKPIIRVNVSKKNCNNISDLLLFLDQYSKFIRSVTFSPVFNINGTPKQCVENMLSRQEFAKLENDYLDVLRNL